MNNLLNIISHGVSLYELENKKKSEKKKKFLDCRDICLFFTIDIITVRAEWKAKSSNTDLLSKPTIHN